MQSTDAVVAQSGRPSEIFHPRAARMNEADIRRSAVTGFRWALAGKLSVQLLSWAATIQVLRILSPDDYGINAMAMVVVGFGLMIAEFGLTTALVQAGDLREEDIRRTFAFVLLANAAIFVLIVLAAPVVAAYFDRPELRSLLPVAALNFPILALLALPNALLERGLRFKEKAVSEFVASLVASMVTLASAWYGASYWSLIFGVLAASLVRAVWLNAIVSWPKVPLFRGLGSSTILRFGGGVALGRLLWYLYSNADTVIVGRRLGDGALGIYSVASEIAATPLNKVSAPLTQVMIAAVSRLRDDRRAAQAMALDVLAYVSALAFPVYFGLANVAGELVGLFLSDKWTQAAIVIAILALVGPLRAVSVILMAAITASGVARFQITTMAFACVLFPPAIFVGASLGGVEGAAWAWLISYPVFFLYLSRLALSLLEIDGAALVKLLVVPLCGVLLMTLAIYAVSVQIPNSLELRLAAEILVGAISYAFYLAFADRRMFLRFLPEFLKNK